MPWTHCERDLADDTATCPACGTTKTQWTVQVEATRTFKVARRSMLNLELLDAEGAPVAGERFRATFEDGHAVDGSLDESGRAVVTAAVAGPVTVAFPALAPDDLVAPDGAARVAGGHACPAGRKQTFRLSGVLTTFVIEAPDDARVLGKRFVATLPGGRRVEGTLDAGKRVRVVAPKGDDHVRLELHLDAGEPGELEHGLDDDELADLHDHRSAYLDVAGGDA